MSSFKEEKPNNEESTHNIDEPEEEKLDLANLLKLLSPKGIKCIHLFACEKRILFLLTETNYSYLLIYVPSKFPVYYNSKTITDFIPITDIKIDEDEADEEYIYNNDVLYNVKKGLEIKLPYFANTSIKLSYISKRMILLINRYNEVEKFVFATDVAYNSSYWVIDLENLYIKLNNIDNEINSISNNIINNFYVSFENNKHDVTKYLESKLQEITSANKSIVPYDKYSTRINNIKTKIQSEKNSTIKSQQQAEFRDKNNKIQTEYICELLRWENFFNKINKIK